jgi:hypothetical protein
MYELSKYYLSTYDIIVRIIIKNHENPERKTGSLAKVIRKQIHKLKRIKPREIKSHPKKYPKLLHLKRKEK